MKFVTYFTSLAMIFTALSFANESALVSAAKNNDLAKVKAAIGAGEDVNTASQGGATALMWAAKKQQDRDCGLFACKGC
jgi:ankyrin repeat protein